MGDLVTWPLVCRLSVAILNQQVTRNFKKGCWHGQTSQCHSMPHKASMLCTSESPILNVRSPYARQTHSLLSNLVVFMKDYLG